MSRAADARGAGPAGAAAGREAGAGADHVAIHLIAGPGTDPDAGFRRLASLLSLP